METLFAWTQNNMDLFWRVLQQGPHYRFHQGLGGITWVTTYVTIREEMSWWFDNIVNATAVAW